VFMALMRALSRPGEVQTLEARGEHGLEAVGKALLDLETSFYTPDPPLHHTFLRLGARADSPEKAAYLFFPLIDAAALEAVTQASVGSLLYPDHAATVVAGAALENGPRLHLRGPGIKDFKVIQADLPQHFWTLRNQRIAFPLGWDLILISSEWKLIGIPRSTKVEVL